jgi:hypothetical protein
MADVDGRRARTRTPRVMCLHGHGEHACRVEWEDLGERRRQDDVPCGWVRSTFAAEEAEGTLSRDGIAIVRKDDDTVRVIPRAREARHEDVPEPAHDDRVHVFTVRWAGANRTVICESAEASRPGVHPAMPFTPSTPRIVGLALVLVSLEAFFGLTMPGGPWYGSLFAGALGVCGTLFGMPLLVMGTLRQPRA